MTVHTTKIGNSTFYINRTPDGLNYNRVLDNGRTFNYQNCVKYYKSLKKAKKQFFNS